MSERLSDDDVVELRDFVMAFVPSRGAQLFMQAESELRERRAADLSDEERAALSWIADRMREDIEGARSLTRVNPKSERALDALDKLLARKP